MLHFAARLRVRHGAARVSLFKTCKFYWTIRASSSHSRTASHQRRSNIFPQFGTKWLPRISMGLTLGSIITHKDRTSPLRRQR
jgi:hypothetical protein